MSRDFRPAPEHRRIVFLTGAGLSARTGLGQFRGPGGLWRLEPELEAAMHGSALPASLPLLWRVWGRMARIAAAHGPTPGHLAIARLGAPVITQNIDGLHQAAGSADVSELHGSALRAVCLDGCCDWSIPLSPGEGDRAEDHGAPAQCPVCGAPTRPDVVLFDEQLPGAAIDRSLRLAREAELFVVVGTSGAVLPAARLAPLAREAGARTVLIDIDPPPAAGLRGVFDEVIRADCHDVLPSWERARRGVADNPFLHPF
ncbi:SIR2 family NAD-dependent protein deacylase [Brachybacterium hainanense]|uniref:protein acetyllysine N-acetyltransferase n=1 Tax=Brachybacterium hainanense TaxID=1541174 RepID=A0ABV6RDW2_9MICO